MTLNRNQNSHFAKNPQVDVSRSTFTRDSSIKTTFNVGDIVPFYVDEVLPGDTFDVETSKLVRMQTLVAPIMDNIYLDTYYFFVPNRIIWDKWEKFLGDNPEGYWLNTTDVPESVPFLTPPAGGWKVGSLADYMGIPTGVENFAVNQLPFLAYGKIYNDWFRDENTMPSQLLNAFESGSSGLPLDNCKDKKPNDSVWPMIAARGGCPLKAGKFRDYFTSCLPGPQKGPDVTIPIGEKAPVITQGEDNLASDFTSGSPYSVRFKKYGTDGSWINAIGTLGVDSQSRLVANNTTFSGSGTLVPTNLVANLEMATATSVNSLRVAFQLQKLYEKDARGGTRYIEILANHFGVTAPDSRLQRAEYLGGNRMMVNINQVVQTSSTDSTSPQGNTSAYSLTTDSHQDFVKSFTEHGFVIGVMVARYNHSYQQGVEKMWLRGLSDYSLGGKFSYYWPMFANIGEQPVNNIEIYAQGNSSDSKTFGYQEAWADYRYKPNKVTGEMRSQYETSLDVWHLADFYDTLPVLSGAWIQEDGSVVDRALAVSSDVSAQLFGDFYIKNRTTRAMPLFSIPGLIDHH